MRSVRVALATLLLLALAQGPNVFARADKLTICHATGSESNPYVQITIAKSAVVNAHINHQHTEDIIPPFTYGGVDYELNWNAEGQAIWRNDCEVETSTPTPTPAPTPTPTPTPSPTPTATDTASPSPTTPSTPTSTPIPPQGTLPPTDTDPAPTGLAGGDNPWGLVLLIIFVAVGLGAIPFDRFLDRRRDARLRNESRPWRNKLR